MGRLFVIANRLAFSISKKGDEFSFRTRPGGLATGLSSLLEIRKLGVNKGRALA